MTIASRSDCYVTDPAPCLLGVWPAPWPISEGRAAYLASVELATMCAGYRVLPVGPQHTVILRTLHDCIRAARTLEVRTSRLMHLVEELAEDTCVAVAASVPVCSDYLRGARRVRELVA